MYSDSFCLDIFPKSSSQCLESQVPWTELIRFPILFPPTAPTEPQKSTVGGRSDIDLAACREEAISGIEQRCFGA